MRPSTLLAAQDVEQRGSAARRCRRGRDRRDRRARGRPRPGSPRAGRARSSPGATRGEMRTSVRERTVRQVAHRVRRVAQHVRRRRRGRCRCTSSTTRKPKPSPIAPSPNGSPGARQRAVVAREPARRAVARDAEGLQLVAVDRIGHGRRPGSRRVGAARASAASRSSGRPAVAGGLPRPSWLWQPWQDCVLNSGPSPAGVSRNSRLPDLKVASSRKPSPGGALRERLLVGAVDVDAAPPGKSSERSTGDDDDGRRAARGGVAARRQRGDEKRAAGAARDRRRRRRGRQLALELVGVLAQVTDGHVERVDDLLERRDLVDQRLDRGADVGLVDALLDLVVERHARLRAGCRSPRAWRRRRRCAPSSCRRRRCRPARAAARPGRDRSPRARRRACSGRPTTLLDAEPVEQEVAVACCR